MTTKITNDNITSMDAGKLTGSLPTSMATDTSKLEYNQALLAFKVASSNQLAKFQMVDQVVDEYQDATGIDAGNSTNEILNGTGTAKYIEGGISASVTTSSTGSVASTGTVDGDYTYYEWLSGSTGTFTTDIAQDYEYLVIAGGGGGGGDNGGGGGAGGYRTATGFSIPAGTITGITVGTSGAKGNGHTDGGNGGNSVFSSIISIGGGRGSASVGSSGTGGSGGGGSQVVAGSAGTAGQGNAGGNGSTNSGGAGGGGAGSEGEHATTATGSTSVGDGGTGLTSSITGVPVTRAGGGGGGANQGSGSEFGLGGGSAITSEKGGGGDGDPGAGGGTQAFQNGIANTGGGGGGGGQSASAGGGTGGSGIVIIRRPTTASVPGNNLTLQSTATTAESVPTTADLVVLIEDGAGTATVNTDIKGYISRDGSAFSTAVTFVDEGDWGTNKRILVARNVDISGIASGTAMKYKLTTHNQSASSKETRIHATSLAWA